jgi:deoxycytidylate deaminase
VNTTIDPLEFAELCARRSPCRVQVGAAISDCRGIFAWGWNHAGPDGLGLCAERMALQRANRSRLPGATLTVVALRRGKEITSTPCPCCERAIVAAKVPWVSSRNVAGVRVRTSYPRAMRRSA